jgi:CelD/BcsL family acetyltransferase involved in cellulose biosynthesis
VRAELLATDAPAWTAFLRDAEHDFYHLPAYVRLSAKVDGGEPGAVLVEDGVRRLLLPLVLRAVEDGVRDATSPYGYPGPILAEADDAFAADALAEAVRFLAGEKIVALFVRGHPLLGPALPSTVGTVVEHGPTVSADLTRSPEALWQATASAHRTQIEKSQRVGHRAFFDDAFWHLGTFVALYRETMERVGAADYYRFSDDYFRELKEALGPRLRLGLVEIGGAIAAAALFVESGPVVQYHLSATDPRFRREGPTKLLLHFAREWAQERGVRRLHLGGGVGGAEDGLFAFKAGFATDHHCFRTLRVVTDEPAYAALVAARDATADPADRSGFFPLYRR